MGINKYVDLKKIKIFARRKCYPEDNILLIKERKLILENLVRTLKLFMGII